MREKSKKVKINKTKKANAGTQTGRQQTGEVNEGRNAKSDCKNDD